MIKINLLKNSNARGETYLGTRTNIGFSSSESMNKGQLLLKLLIVVLMPLALWYFEQERLKAGQLTLARLQNEMTSVDAELAAKASVSEVLKQFTAEKAKLEKRVEVVRELNKARLKDVRALDALQNLMPTKAWINRISIDKDAFNLIGYSLTSDDISVLMRGLETSVFFSEVLLTSSIEEMTRQGTLKKFEVKGGVEAN